MSPVLSLLPKSRPTGARGLKLFLIMIIKRFFLVASHRGAWIEINSYGKVDNRSYKSRPTGARGLKSNKRQKLI